ncbi:hypothetical protein PAHAL_9G388900 [Panicum hallii]|uniref:Uncharacterized protein n=1 Tax=Panicum hallii TaxID=206008 RepID=A0A2T8I401_9POAL|nr:hypothetical protein PAHAL_9G388900 [Panicum hallii]
MIDEVSKHLYISRVGGDCISEGNTEEPYKYNAGRLKTQLGMHSRSATLVFFPPRTSETCTPAPSRQ